MAKHLRTSDIERIIKAAEDYHAVARSKQEWSDASEFTPDRVAEIKPKRQALAAAIETLSDGARKELVALMLVGRGDTPDATFDDYLEQGKSRSKEDDIAYAIEKSLGLPKYLRDGLKAAGKSI